MSGRKEDQLTRLSVVLTYGESQKVWNELTGFRSAKKTIHRTTQKVGAKMLEAQNEISLLQVQEQREKRKQRKKSKGLGEEIKEQVGADGVLVNIRGEGWKEAKVGVCYEVDGEKNAKNILYSATLRSREESGKQLYRLAGAPKIEEAAKMGFIADGGDWLDTMRKTHFRKATAIVDYYHVTEYISPIATSFYGEGTEKSLEWSKEKRRVLKEGGHKKILSDFKKMKPKTDQQKQKLHEGKSYFTNQGYKMNYPEYQAKGFHIGSGVIEGGCKHVVENRFKRAGMRWSRQGAERMMCLRALYLNDQWDVVIQEAA